MKQIFKLRNIDVNRPFLNIRNPRIEDPSVDSYCLWHGHDFDDESGNLQVIDQIQATSYSKTGAVKARRLIGGSSFYIPVEQKIMEYWTFPSSISVYEVYDNWHERVLAHCLKSIINHEASIKKFMEAANTVKRMKQHGEE